MVQIQILSYRLSSLRNILIHVETSLNSHWNTLPRFLYDFRIWGVLHSILQLTWAKSGERTDVSINDAFLVIYRGRHYAPMNAAQRMVSISHSLQVKSTDIGSTRDECPH